MHLSIRNSSRKNMPPSKYYVHVTEHNVMVIYTAGRYTMKFSSKDFNHFPQVFL